MVATPALAELQHWLLAAIMRPADIESLSAAEIVSASRSQCPADRLAVYQHAYLARLLDVLREQFPCTRFAVGDELFDQFALGYLEQHPPTSYTLANLAGHLAEYLEATRPPDMAGSGFIVELARLEQAIDCVFDGPGPENLPPLALPAAASGDLRLALAPGAQFHAFAYPASTYYSAWKAGQQPEWPQPQPQHIALFRRDYIVRRLELSALQHAILRQIAAGNPLGVALAQALQPAAVEAADSTIPSGDEFATDIRNWFTHWAAAGLFTAAG